MPFQASGVAADVTVTVPSGEARVQARENVLKGAPVADRSFAVEASSQSLGISDYRQFAIPREREAVERTVQEVYLTLKCRRAIRWQFMH